MSDEQFHEFHLDGKQMVFLFMASTVVAVVIFLCGVMVGRGVRANKNAETVEAAAGVFSGDAAEAPAANGGEPARSETGAPSTAAAATDSARLDAPAVTAEKPAEGEAPQPVDETAPQPAAEAPARTPVAPLKPTKAPADAASDREPAGARFSVQVSSGKTHAAAEAQVNELKAKGFDSFMVPMPAGKSGFRVRVGKFKTMSEARAAKERLQKIPKYRDAWISPV
jgi:cell division protein FtsN